MTTPDRPDLGHSTIVEERVDVRTDDGDHDRFSHYVVKGKLTEAMVLGTPLTARRSTRASLEVRGRTTPTPEPAGAAPARR